MHLNCNLFKPQQLFCGQFYQIQQAKHMNISAITQNLGAIQIHLDITAIQEIHKFIDKLGICLQDLNSVHSIYASTAIFGETTKLMTVQSRIEYGSPICIEKLLINAHRNGYGNIVPSIKNISRLWNLCPSGLIEKVKNLQLGYLNYQKYAKISKMLGIRMNIDAHFNMLLSAMFWLLYAYIKLQQNLHKFFQKTNEPVQALLALIYVCFAEAISIDDFHRLFTSQYYHKTQESLIEKTMIKQNPISNGYELKVEPDTPKPSLQILGSLKSQFQAVFDKLLQKRQENKRFSLSEVVSSVIKNKEERLEVTQIIMIILKSLEDSKTNSNQEFPLYDCIYLFLDSDVSQFLCSYTSEVSGYFVKEMGVSPQFDNKQINEKWKNQMERYRRNIRSTPMNDQYITPTNFLSKFSSFLLPSDASSSAFSIKKDTNSLTFNKDQIKQQMIRSKLQLMSWVRSCIQSVTAGNLAIVKAYYEHFNGQNSYPRLFDFLNIKYSEIIEKFCPTCINPNNRKTQMYKFFIYFYVLTAKEFPKIDELALLFNYEQNFGPYLALTANIFNYCYYLEVFPMKNGHQLGDSNSSFPKYCEIFEIELLYGYQPINWIGSHFKAPLQIINYLYSLETSILFRDMFQQPKLLQKFIYISSQRKNNVGSQQRTLKRTLRRMKEQVIVNLYEKGKSIFKFERHVRQFYPLINFILSKQIPLLFEIGYQPLIYLTLVMGLSSQSESNQLFIEKIVREYLKWRQGNKQKALVFEKQINISFMPEKYLATLQFFSFYNQIFLPRIKAALESQKINQGFNYKIKRIEINKYLVRVRNNFGNKMKKQRQVYDRNTGVLREDRQKDSEHSEIEDRLQKRVKRS